MVFDNRYEAGARLAEALKDEVKRGENSIVLALARGGVPIGSEIAKRLNLPLSVIVSRKLGAPGNEEFGIGAISELGSVVLDQASIRGLGLTRNELKRVIQTERAELKRRIKVYRGGKNLPDLQNRTVILADDGLATSVSARAAIKALKKRSPKRIIFASPVCAQDSLSLLSGLVDRVVCLVIARELVAIGNWYRDFSQISDDEVVRLLQERQAARL